MSDNEILMREIELYAKQAVEYCRRNQDVISRMPDFAGKAILLQCNEDLEKRYLEFPAYVKKILFDDLIQTCVCDGELIKVDNLDDSFRCSDCHRCYHFCQRGSKPVFKSLYCQVCHADFKSI